MSKLVGLTEPEKNRFRQLSSGMRRAEKLMVNVITSKQPIEDRINRYHDIANIRANLFDKYKTLFEKLKDDNVNECSCSHSQAEGRVKQIVIEGEMKKCQK